VTFFNKTDKFYNAPRIRKPYIPASVLLLIAFCSACYITLHAIGYFDAGLALRITENVLMPTNADLFSTKPWTLITSMFFHTSPLPFLANMMGILIFGNLTSLFFSKKVVVPLFFAGGLIGAVSIWVFKYLPLTHDLLNNSVIAGSSGGMMTQVYAPAFRRRFGWLRVFGDAKKISLSFRADSIFLFAQKSVAIGQGRNEYYT
jgi:membrane associated rhomboid family serine protease